jgi:hypothetical protein
VREVEQIDEKACRDYHKLLLITELSCWTNHCPINYYPTTELMDVCESGQHLQTQLSQRGHREISGDAVGGVGREEIAVEIKEGVSQEFRHNEQMLLWTSGM